MLTDAWRMPPFQKDPLERVWLRPVKKTGRGAGLLTLSLLVLLPAPAAEAAAPATCTSTPFRSNAAYRVVYRIPAMVTTKAGTVLAFAERRRITGSASDLTDTEVVLARSTDRGCHWSAPKVIADHGPDTVGNPSPVVDTTTGVVMLFTVDRAPKSTTDELHLQRSTDDGKTFTAYSKAGNAVSGIPRSPGGLTGPGHAIQLQSPNSPHRGRIIVPLSYRKGDSHGAYAIVSDDHGAHWKVGYDNMGRDGRIEGTVAELSDGRLWISYHARGAQPTVGTGRISTFSNDGGSTIAAPFSRTALPVVSIQGSALGLTGRYAGSMLFSSPARPDKAVRHRMAVFSSRGSWAGKSWSSPYDVQLNNRPGSYSDLAQVTSETVGVLFETGQTSWEERIDFRSLRIADILGPAPVTPTVNITAPNPQRSTSAFRPSVVVKVPGASSPVGEFRVRLRGRNVDRSQTLPLYMDSEGRRLASFGTLARGTYQLEVRYVGTARIKSVTTTRTITVK